MVPAGGRAGEGGGTGGRVTSGAAVVPGMTRVALDFSDTPPQDRRPLAPTTARFLHPRPPSLPPSRLAHADN